MKSHTILLPVFFCATCFLASTLQHGMQRNPTNTNIFDMTKSGIGEQTITKKDCGQVFDAVLASAGDHDALIAVHSTRWRGKEVIASPAARQYFSSERVFVLPSSFYATLQSSSGPTTTLVYTPEFNYLASGKMTTAIPAATLEAIQAGAKLDLLSISQHRDQFKCTLEGTEQIEAVATTQLRVRGDGVEIIWNVDSKTNRLVRSTFKRGMPDQEVTDYSEWKQINGIYVSFVRHGVKGKMITDLSIDEFQVNPTIDPNLFKAPTGQIASAITFKVLQRKSVPHSVQADAAVSTMCSISGSTDNLQMSCNSSDTTIPWTHTLNAMLVEASDGNAYIIACDWVRGSQCGALKAEETFWGRRSEKGFVIQLFNKESEELEETYNILDSRPLR